MLRQFQTAAAFALICGSVHSAAGQCEPEWLGGFAPPELGGNHYRRIFDVEVFDPGDGPRLIVCGEFSRLGDVTAIGLAERRDGQWMPLYSSAAGWNLTYTMTVFDDGSGPALYVGGTFARIEGTTVNNIARWDGVTWSPLGSGILPQAEGSVRGLRAFDDGTGPALYAIGNFDTAGGKPARNIARWDGREWSAVGLGTGGLGDVGAVYDDGSGPALYVGGLFTEAGGVAVDGIARWDGEEWSAVGCVGGSQTPFIGALAVADFGDGSALYVGGGFSTIGCMPADNLAKWDGENWTPFGFPMPPGGLTFVNDLLIVDEPAGPALYASGSFGEVNGQTAKGVAKWDGEIWTPVGEGMDLDRQDFREVRSLAFADVGDGPRLYAGGWFHYADSAPAACVAEWNGRRWAGLDQGLGNPHAMAVADDGGGRTLFVAGAGGLSQLPDYENDVVKWEDGRWRQLPGDFSIISFPWLRALAEYDDGSGPRVILGGSFRLVDPICYNIAAWDGMQWTAVGDGLFGSSVDALAVFDDGGGPGLFVGGEFAHAGQVKANNIARWRDQRWSRLRLGTDGPVRALFAGDAGEGASLYVGGTFATAGQQAVSNIARWNDGWFDVGGGANGTVLALAIFDDGSGPALYVGGEFTEAGGLPVSHIARFDGTAWTALGDGVNAVVRSLQVHDDGSGPALYVGGEFTHAGDLEVNGVARWNGEAWTALADGLDWSASEAIVRAMASFDDGGGSALWVGGFMRTASGIPSRGIAKWACPDGGGCDPCDTNCDGVVDAADVDPFIALLLDPNPSPCAPCAGDTNADGSIDAFDIEPFVQCLTP